MKLTTKYILAAVGLLVFVFLYVNYQLFPPIYFVPIGFGALIVFLFHKYDMKKLFKDVAGGSIPKGGEDIKQIKQVQEEADNLYPFLWEKYPEKIHIKTRRRDINGEEKKILGISGPYRHPRGDIYYGRLVYMFPDGDILHWDPEAPGDSEIRLNPLKDLKYIMRTEGYKNKQTDEDKFRERSAVTINTPYYTEEDEE